MDAVSSPAVPRSSSPSAAALRLGHAGLLPFVGGALLVWLVWPEAHPYTTLALSAYAAVIVSFLGGIHWGLGMLRGDAAHFAWGVVPSLVAWPALLLPPAPALAVLAAAVLVCFVVDRRVYPACGLQAWLALRLPLTAVAALSCAAGAAALAGTGGTGA